MERMFASLLRHVVKVGRLTLIDVKGRRYECGDPAAEPVILRLHDRRVAFDLLRNPQLTLGEAYMDGRISVDGGSIADLLDLVALNIGTGYGGRHLDWIAKVRHLFRAFTPRNGFWRAERNVAHHYDLSGQLYDLFLDSDKQYSCAFFERSDDTLETAQANKKRQIAVAASRMIEDNDTILLDGGSTTYELAQLLVGRPLQVVTNSLPVANLFTSSGNADLVFVGGYMHAKTGVSLGPYANQMLAGLNVRRAVLSVAGINERGAYNSNLLLVETERAMMTSAEEVIVVADSTKFGHTSLSQLCELSEIDVLITDDQLDEAWRERLTAAEVKLVESLAGFLVVWSTNSFPVPSFLGMRLSWR